MGVVQHLIERDDLARMSSHSTHAARKASRDTSFDFVVRRIVLNCRYEDFPFVLIRVALIGGNPLWRPAEFLVVVDGRRSAAVAGTGGNCGALGAMDIA